MVVNVSGGWHYPTFEQPHPNFCQGLPYEKDKDALIPPRARLHGGGGPKVGEVGGIAHLSI